MKLLLKILILTFIFFGGSMIVFLDRVIYTQWPQHFKEFKKWAWWIQSILFVSAATIFIILACQS